MSPDQTFLQGFAAESGFRVETLEKVVRLGEVLGDVARHPLLSIALALKGGTAINLCFGEPRRLSVDLDFNYVGKLDREEMRLERPEIERAIRSIAASQRYEIQESSEEHGGRKFFLGFRRSGGSRDRIEIDINFLYREPIVPARAMVVWQPPGLDRPTARVVGFAELAGGKLTAFLDRVAARDVYDVAHLPLLDPEAWFSDSFRKIFIAMSSTLPHALHTYVRSRLDRLTDRVVESELAPMLARKDPASASELATRAWTAVAPLLELSDQERDFVDGIQAGEIRSNRLFPDDPETASRISRHPAVLWKVENARAQTGRGR